MFKKHFFKILLGCLFSAALIWLTLRQIDFRKSFELIKNADYYILMPGVLIYAFTYALRAVRYYFMLLPVKKTRIFENFPYTVLGFFMNNIIPLRLGEVVRAKVTGERLGVSRSSVLATIVVERLMDVIIFVAFFFIIMIVMPFPEFIKRSFYVSGIVFGGALAMLFLISKNDEQALNFVSKLPMPQKVKSFVTKLFDKFTGGLMVLRKPAIMSSALFITVLTWVTESFFLVMVAYSCGIKISILGGIFVVIIIGIGAIIPTAPGYIGAVEFMGVTAFGALGVAKDHAFACIAIYHFLQIIVISALGLASILKEKISFADLFKFETAVKN
ncbi:MAG: flippase-like domain-containing protein [Endomicrobia bacterium]|nr:flippase-like domain-containing protein [Endomicrobiia bacterium]